MRFSAAGLAFLATGIAGGAGAEQPVHGPVAVYWMSAATSSGMGSMMGGGAPGGRPDPRAMMSMAFGGAQNPNAFNHSLVLQLGSSRGPTSQPPAAEHDPPAGLGAGPVLPLRRPPPTRKPNRALPPNTASHTVACLYSGAAANTPGPVSPW